MNHNFAAYYRGCGGPSILSMHGNENVYSSLSSLHELGKPKRKAKHSAKSTKLRVVFLIYEKKTQYNTVLYRLLLILAIYFIRLKLFNIGKYILKKNVFVHRLYYFFNKYLLDLVLAFYI